MTTIIKKNKTKNNNNQFNNCSKKYKIKKRKF